MGLFIAVMKDGMRNEEWKAVFDALEWWGGKEVMVMDYVSSLGSSCAHLCSPPQTPST